MWPDRDALEGGREGGREREERRKGEKEGGGGEEKEGEKKGGIERKRERECMNCIPSLPHKARDEIHIAVQGSVIQQIFICIQTGN